MFIIIIVAICIIIYLANLNSRITTLENKLKTTTIIPTPVSQPVVQPVTQVQEYIAPTPAITEAVQEVKPHQDNFAKNLAKFGIAILVLGVLFFLRYIDSQGWIGPVFKYVAGLSFGVVLLGIAEYLKNKNKYYVNLLRGGAFIIFYLTLFIGYMVFHIVSLPVTLGLVAAVLAISVIISIRENEALPFTCGALGAYLVSFIIGLQNAITTENLVGLLAYVLILNCAIIFVSLKKNWIESSIIGFLLTWSIFISVLSSGIDKNILFIFSTIYGLQYLTIFLIQDFKQVRSRNTVYLTVINTLIYLMIFYKLVSNTILFDYVGYFVALLGVFHFAVYMLLRNMNKSSTGNVTLTHFVISVLLISAAIPLQFDGPIVTMMWFFEGIMLSFLSTLNDFKNKPIMYALSFISILAGIMHMMIFGVYVGVMKTGIIFFNQSYVVWFAVFLLLNIVAYIWYNTVAHSTDIEFKNSIKKIAFTLVVVGQVLFVCLTASEINKLGEYRTDIVRQEISEKTRLERQLNPNDYYSYDNQTTADYTQVTTISRETTFMQLMLFIIMTIIYFMVGLIKKNKVVRNMGIITLSITSLLLITLTWALGPVFRIITFVGFGILLLIVSYLYISKNKKTDIAKALMILMSVGLFAATADANVIETKNWTTIADLKVSDTNVVIDNQNLFILPINKDLVILSKKNDLTDIRIIDKDKNEIPYIMVKSNQDVQAVSEETFDVKILENSIDRNGKRVLVIDTNREGLLYNELFLQRDDKSTNFRKLVKVYISDSKLSAGSPAWRELEQRNVVYNYTDTTSFMVEDLSINLAGASSRYIKIELTDDTEFDKNIKVNNRITVTGAQVKYVKDEEKTPGFTVKDYLSGNFVFDKLTIYKDIKLLNDTTNGTKSELTFEGEIDVEEITLQVDKDDTNFNRNLVIQGSNDDLEWPTIGTGNIYRIDSPLYKGEKLTITIPSSTYKKFRVIIQNDNNKPLDIQKNAKAKIQNTGVLFKLEDGMNVSDLQIIVGDNTELSPIYDIRSIINYFENVVPQMITYENVIKNPEYVPAKRIIPFGEQNKIFLNVGLLIFIVIVGIFGFFWMKNQHHE